MFATFLGNEAQLFVAVATTDRWTLDRLDGCMDGTGTLLRGTFDLKVMHLLWYKNLYKTHGFLSAIPIL